MQSPIYWEHEPEDSEAGEVDGKPLDHSPMSDSGFHHAFLFSSASGKISGARPVLRCLLGSVFEQLVDSDSLGSSSAAFDLERRLNWAFPLDSSAATPASRQFDRDPGKVDSVATVFARMSLHLWLPKALLAARAPTSSVTDPALRTSCWARPALGCTAADSKIA